MVSWTIDTTSPVAALNSVPSGAIGPVAVDVLVGGDGVAAYRYSLDGTAWSPVRPVSRPIRIPELPEGIHHLEVIAADQSNNWQALENATSADWEVDATVPTAYLGNLPATVTNQTSTAIDVISPPGGIPVERYAYTLDGGNSWWYGGVDEPIEIDVLNEGTHTICVNVFGDDRWQDGADGISSTANATCYTWRVDLTPTDPVNLDIVAASFEERTGICLEGIDSVKLSWTWASDDVREVLKRYRIWFSETPLDETTLPAAEEVFCDILPGLENVVEDFVINGLRSGKTYYFAVKSIDMAGNESGISNVAALTIGDRAPRLHGVALESGGMITDNAALASLVIEGADFMEADESNLVRFENSNGVFDFLSESGASDRLLARIPLGTPTGVYRVRVINKNGASGLSPDTITIGEAPLPLPVVRRMMPSVVTSGYQTRLTITGEHFNNPPERVQLAGLDGVSIDLTEIVWKSADVLTAAVDVPADFPEGRFDIRVFNTDTEYNELSVSKVEIHRPVVLSESFGTVTTMGAVLVGGEATPVGAVVKTDDRIQAGGMFCNPAKMKFYLEPGMVFDEQEQTQEDTQGYTGLILPPRRVQPSDVITGTLGVDAVQFTMGSATQLRLKDGVTLFFTIEVMLPSDSAAPVIYHVPSDGELTPAGVPGMWRDIPIDRGGTPLSVLQDFPEEGFTTTTYGLILGHMSEYALGILGEDGVWGGDDAYGLCWIGNVVSDAGAVQPQHGCMPALAAGAVAMAIFVLAGLWVDRRRRRLDRGF